MKTEAALAFMLDNIFSLMWEGLDSQHALTLGLLLTLLTT